MHVLCDGQATWGEASYCWCARCCVYLLVADASRINARINFVSFFWWGEARKMYQQDGGSGGAKGRAGACMTCTCRIVCTGTLMLFYKAVVGAVWWVCEEASRNVAASSGAIHSYCLQIGERFKVAFSVVELCCVPLCGVICVKWSNVRFCEWT